jgi:hypothetical protein
MAAPNLFSLFEGYKAQADLEHSDAQRAEQARSAQLRFDIDSRQEAEAQDGAQARANNRELLRVQSEADLEDQPAALAAKLNLAKFDRATQAATQEAETPGLGMMATQAATLKQERLGLALRQQEHLTRQEDIRQRISADQSLAALDALEVQQVARDATLRVLRNSEYQALNESVAQATQLMPVLQTAAANNDMVMMNRAGAMMGLEFKPVPAADGSPAHVEFSEAGKNSWSPWLGQESVPGWKATQDRKMLIENQMMRDAQAALIQQQKNAELQMEAEKFRQQQQAKNAEAVAQREHEIKMLQMKGEAKGGAVPSLLPVATTQAAASTPAQTTIFQAPQVAAPAAPEPIPTKLRELNARAVVPAPLRGTSSPRLLPPVPKKEERAVVPAPLRGMSSPYHRGAQ